MRYAGKHLLVSLIFLLLSACASTPPNPPLAKPAGALSAPAASTAPIVAPPQPAVPAPAPPATTGLAASKALNKPTVPAATTSNSPAATLMLLSQYTVPVESLKAQKAKPADQQITAPNPSSPQQATSGSADITQALADVITQRATVEVSTWTEEELGDRFCSAGAETRIYLLQTCGVMYGYLQNRVYTAASFDSLGLQAALRTDLKNYVAFRLWKLERDKQSAVAWRWIFLGSIVDDLQNNSLQDVLGWIKDVRFIQHTCSQGSDDSDACKLYLKSELIKAIGEAKEPDKTDALIKTIADDLAADGMQSIFQFKAGATVAELDTLVCLAFDGKISDYKKIQDEVALAKRFEHEYRGLYSANGLSEAALGAFTDDLHAILTDIAGNYLQLSDTEFKNIDEMIVVYAAASQKNYRMVVQELWETGDGQMSCDNNAQAETESCRLLLVADDIVSADTTNDLATALDNISSSSGSVPYKTTAKGLLTLTGVLGVDYEKDTLDGGEIRTTVPAKGIFAPVGLEYTFPWYWKSSAGIFLTFLDLGNLVSYSNTTNTNGAAIHTNPNTNLSQVTSLGFYFVWNDIHQSPFVIGIGTSYTPAWRTATLSNGQTQPLDAHRILVWFGVDVTFFSMCACWW